MTDSFEYAVDRITAHKEQEERKAAALRREQESAAVDAQTVTTAVNAWNAAVASTPAPVSNPQPVDFSALRTSHFAHTDMALYAMASAEAAKHYRNNRSLAVAFINEWLKGYEEGHGEGLERSEEAVRQRFAEIFALPEAEGREALMQKLALTTNLAPDTIKTILGTTPKQASSEFAKHLAHLGFPADPHSKDVTVNPWNYAFSQKR